MASRTSHEEAALSSRDGYQRGRARRCRVRCSTSAQAGPCTTAPAGPSCPAYLIGTVVDTVENVDQEVTEVRDDAFAAVRTAEDLVDQLGNDTDCQQGFEREDCFNF